MAETENNRASCGAAIRPVRVNRLIPLALAVVVALVFLPSLRNDFVDWDDRPGLLENPDFRGFGWKQLRWMFTTFHLGPYQPLSWLTFAVDHHFWGMSPVGYHLTNLLLHAANAVLAYWLFRRLLHIHYGGRGPGAGDRIPTRDPRPPIPVCAGLAALFFALHPLRVESVAWATERRDVLSGLFFLLTLLAWLRAARARRTGVWLKWLALALALYVAALLSKAIVMVLPAVLIVLDFYPLGRLGYGRRGLETGRRNPIPDPSSSLSLRAEGRSPVPACFGAAARRVWLEKMPFIVAAAVFAGVALYGQKHAGALIAADTFGLFHRLAFAAHGTMFYVTKTVLPFGLCPLYEIPYDMNPFELRFVASGVAALGITVLLIAYRRTWPGGLAAWVCYLVILAPVSGLCQAGAQIAADRYSYLSCLPLALLGGAGVLALPRAKAWARGAVLGMVIAATLGVLTVGQIGVWRDSSTLWTHVLKSAPDCSTAHTNICAMIGKQKRPRVAVIHAFRACRLNPLDPRAHQNLGAVLVQLGEAKAAIPIFERAIELKPDIGESHNDLGVILATQGQLAEAADHLYKAVAALPRKSEARFNLAQALSRLGDWRGAVHHYRAAIQIDPSDVDARLDLAWLLATCPDPELRDGPEALGLARRAIRARERASLTALDVLAAACAETGRFSEAGETAGKAAQLAIEAGLEEQAAMIRARQAIYRSGKPYRLSRQRPGAKVNPVHP